MRRNRISAIAARLATAPSRNKAFPSRFAANRSRLTAPCSRLTASRSRLTTMRSRLTALLSRLMELRSQLTANPSRITAIRSRITTMRSRVTTARLLKNSLFLPAGADESAELRNRGGSLWRWNKVSFGRGCRAWPGRRGRSLLFRIIRECHQRLVRSRLHAPPPSLLFPGLSGALLERARYFRGLAGFPSGSSGRETRVRRRFGANWPFVSAGPFRRPDVFRGVEGGLALLTRRIGEAEQVALGRPFEGQAAHPLKPPCG